MRKLCFSENKTLRLTNVLSFKVDFEDEDSNLNIVIDQMQAYIRSRGANQVGPLIQKTRMYMNEEGELEMEVVLMLQCDSFIHSVQRPYYMDSVIRLCDCLYCRYIGPEETISFACDKIQIEAFERGIDLKGDNYTIYVNRDEKNETITADVFIEREE